MKIRNMNLYHGAALTQITEHNSFKALNKVDDQYGHYLVNQDTRLLVSYRSREFSPWSFSFKEDYKKVIEEDMRITENVYLCLVCGESTICALSIEEFSQLIDISTSERQYIYVDVPPGGSMHVTGSAGDLPNVISHNSFPDKIFEAAAIDQPASLQLSKN